jgi:hypothetical protein
MELRDIKSFGNEGGGRKLCEVGLQSLMFLVILDFGKK